MLNPTDAFEPDAERAAGDVIDGEAIIINLATGAYYSMQGIGGEIWAMIAERRDVSAMVERIAAAYDVDPASARHDLEAVLEQLLGEHLIRPCPPAPAESAGLVPAAKRAYSAPRLEIYRDMEELLALDPPAPGMSQIAWKS
jgi:hypothetical protein